MPVRFQVDGDFYDHPKTLGMSDAAVALWTRAGSYSVAKRTDGFIPEHVLRILTEVPESAEELVTRDLWKRVKGGYKYHQWVERNLTKAKIDAFTDGARSRKRKQRERERVDEKPQVSPENVTQKSRVTGSGVSHEGHANVTPLSLSLSVSESESVSSLPRIPRGGKGTRIPDPFTVDEAMKDWAVERHMDPQWVLRQTERFINYWTAAAGAKGVKTDWRATWRNWLLKAQDDAPAAASPAPRNGYAKDDVRGRFQ